MRITIIALLLPLLSACGLLRQVEDAQYAREQDVLIAQRHAESEREALCHTPWRNAELMAAADARQADAPFDARAGIPQAPSALHDRFARYASALPSKDGAGCQLDRRADFDREWTYLQTRERQRKTMVAQVRAAETEARQQELAAQQQELETRQQEETEVTARAKRHGYSAVFVDMGLAAVLNAAIESATPIEKLRRAAIVVVDADADCTASQVLPDGRALFACEETEARVLVPRRRGVTIYEGTSLVALGMEAVRVASVTTYRTVAGGTAQAFVIEPAW